MPARELQEQLNTLREQLEQNPPLSEAEREDLHVLMQQIEAEIELETKTQDTNLADGVNLAVERFELEHPAIAGTLRNIVLTLGNIGINPVRCKKAPPVMAGLFVFNCCQIPSNWRASCYINKIVTDEPDDGSAAAPLQCCDTG